jgi:membrane protease subunit HflC
MTDHTQNPRDRKRSRRRLLAGIGVALLVLLAVSSVFTVDETEYVIVERLGRIVAVYDRPADRGLHVKLPWPISQARRFDRRLQLLDPAGREVFTRDKKNITVDAFVCWRIASGGDETSQPLRERPVVKFYKALGNVGVAEARLQPHLHSALSDRIGRAELAELLQVSDSEAAPPPDETAPLARVGNDVFATLVGNDEALRDRFGIEVVEVAVKRVNFPLGNQQAVYDRMRSERRKKAGEYRDEGMADNAIIRSQADRQAAEILARADAEATRIRGKADAEAVAILNRAHSRDPEFYTMLQTLDAYGEILNERTTLVLSASSRLFKLLTEGPQLTPPTKDKPPSVGTTSQPQIEEDTAP